MILWEIPKCGNAFLIDFETFLIVAALIPDILEMCVWVYLFQTLNMKDTKMIHNSTEMFDNCLIP